jgi:hypothetical protein
MISVASASASAAAGTTAFVPIVEPFDPGHVPGVPVAIWH